MCGIFGIISNHDDFAYSETRLAETARLLQHRGPDHTGTYTDAHIAFVQTRLSLLDLNPRSNQPFWDAEGNYGLVYNGEIYNFLELREELASQGITFSTTSDTEVLLAAVIHLGLGATLEKIEGMYAFGLYDRRNKTLTIARDRFGIKPLFYHDSDDAFIFSSEIAAMRPWLRFDPDMLSISSFLFGFAGPTKGHTFFKGIKILPPGGIITVKIGHRPAYDSFFSVANLWDDDLAGDLARLKPEKLVDRVDALLLESVQKQLIADAPVGALCSGGLDSSVIMAMAARTHNNLAVFHADVRGPLSEYNAASRLARHLKLDMKTVPVRDRDFIDLIPEILFHYGHPFYITPHSVPFLKVSRLVRESGVKAVLSGEGSDECFLGYNFLTRDFAQWRRLMAQRLKQHFRPILRRLGIRVNATDRPSDFVRGFSPYASIAAAPFTSNRLNLPELVMGMHNRFEVALETDNLVARGRNGNGGPRNQKHLKAFDLLNYNLRMLLHRNDCMGMAASIESRFPFLDRELVKLAVCLPYDARIRFSLLPNNGQGTHITDKWILRRVADRYLPRELSRQPKKPFPVNAYKRMGIAPDFFKNSLILDLFEMSDPEGRYLLDNAPRDLRLKLMQLESWAHVCLFDKPREELSRRLRDHLSVAPQ